MAEIHAVSITYRGRRCDGEWYVQDGLLHVRCPYGETSGPPIGGGRSISTPAERAQRMLWRLVRDADPHKSIMDFWSPAIDRTLRGSAPAGPAPPQLYIAIAAFTLLLAGAIYFAHR